jgi:single-strand DNA-binding protein
MNGTLNKVMLIGHLGMMHYFDGGNCIEIPLATNEVYINKTTNEKITSTEWHNLVAQQSGRNLRKHLSKGIKYMLRAVLNRANGRPRMGPQTY